MATAYSNLYFLEENNLGFTATQITILSPDGVPSKYQLAYGSWQPAVPKKHVNILSGQGPYEDVIEEMTLNILGNSADDCINNLQALWKLLDQANRWSYNEYVPPVSIYYQPKGSVLSAPLRADILANLSDQSILSLPPTYDDVGHIWRINGVTIRFLRRGEWLGAIDTASNTAAQIGRLSSTIALATGNGISAPTDLKLGDFNTTTMPTALQNSALIVGDYLTSAVLGDVRNVDELNPALQATGVKYTSVADGANNAPWTNVLRYTPTDTAYNESTPQAISVMHGKNFAIYILARTNAGSTGFLVKLAEVRTTGARITTRPVLIDGSTLNPRIVPLGVIALAGPDLTAGVVTSSCLVAFQIAALSVAGSLDIAQLILAGIDDETTSIFELDPFTLLAGASSSINVDHNQAATQDSSIIKRPDPRLTNFNLNTRYDLNYIGTMPVMSKADKKNYVFLCPNGVKWQYRTNAGAAVVLTLTVKRQRAYIVPQ